MKLVNIFLKDPCVGWHPVDCSPFNRKVDIYSCTDEFAEVFCETYPTHLKLFKKEVKCIGNAMLVHLTLQSEYAISHFDSNQAHYYVDAVLVNE